MDLRRNTGGKTLPYFPRPLATVAPRDLLLLECLEPRGNETILEIGTGCGSSLFRLAGCVAAFHGLDVAPQSIERIRRALSRCSRPIPNVRLFTLDFCNPRTPIDLPTAYDLIISCDTVEHVADPAAFFANVYAALKPGGRAYITFPNEHPQRAHGITFFERRETIQALLANAGFTRHETQIMTLRMNRWSRWILGLGWLAPRRLAKTIFLLMRAHKPNSLPQTFDQTDFFAVSDRLEFLAPLINAYSWGLMRLMGLAVPVYRNSPAPEMIWDTQILIRATRSAAKGNGARLSNDSPAVDLT